MLQRDCVALNPQARYAGNWNDMACGNRNHYVCQLTRGKYTQLLYIIIYFSATPCKVEYV